MLCYNYLLSTASFENTAATTTSTKVGDQSDMSNKSMYGQLTYTKLTAQHFSTVSSKTTTAATSMNVIPQGDISNEGMCTYLHRQLMCVTLTAQL